MSITINHQTNTVKVDTLEEATSGGATYFTAKAWAKMNASTGSPSIEGDGNISSITDNGAGNYTYNFSDSLTDGNYAANATTSGKVNGAHAMAFLSNWGSETGTYTSSAVQVSTFNDSNSYERADSSKNTLIVAR